MANVKETSGRQSVLAGAVGCRIPYEGARYYAPMANMQYDRTDEVPALTSCLTTLERM